MKQRISVLVALLVVFSMVLTACGGAAPAAAPAETAATATEAAASTEATAEAAAPAASGEAVTIEYWLWDSNQLPAYQACADAFMKANPNIKVNITQSGWNDYWNNIQTGMVAGTAPDIFTDHLAKYPEFAAKEQLVDIQPFVERDGVDISVYLGQLTDLWGRDGKQFGLPKDWDTIAIVYNQTALDAAGVTVDELNNTDLEPGQRRHLWRTDRQAERRRERQQRPEPRLRPHQGQAVRPDHQRRGRRLRPDRVELADQHDRLAGDRRAVCHRLPL